MWKWYEIQIFESAYKTLLEHRQAHLFIVCVCLFFFFFFFPLTCFNSLLKGRRRQRWWWWNGTRESLLSSARWLQVMHRKCLRRLLSCLPPKPDAPTALAQRQACTHVILVLSSLNLVMGTFFSSLREYLVWVKMIIDFAHLRVGDLGQRTSGKSFTVPAGLFQW